MDDRKLAAEFERATKRKRILMFGGLGLVIAAPFLWLGYQHWRADQRIDEAAAARDKAAEDDKLTAADLPQARTAIASVRKALDEADAAWRAVTPDTLRTATLRDQSCPLTFAAPPPRNQLGELVKLPNWNDEPWLAWTYQLVEPGGALEPSEELAAARADLDAGAKLVESGAGTKSEVNRLLGRAQRPAPTVVILVDRHVEPRLTGAKQFSPGLIAGTAYVYGHPQRRPVCAGAIEVESSPFVGTDWDTELALGKQGKDMLQLDLDMEVRRKIAHYLKAAR